MRVNFHQRKQASGTLGQVAGLVCSMMVNSKEEAIALYDTLPLIDYSSLEDDHEAWTKAVEERFRFLADQLAEWRSKQ